uniref:F-box/kelch-repeat protein At3g06240-like n=1 Tax=Erigeron canadensis TaxID=72917 RepID=UPI001CB99535|nr:F-box/kelch-repeat protein At3g06240-like [Erigeron canadensis]
MQEATLPKEYASLFDFDVVLDVVGCCNGFVLLSGFSYCKHRRLNVLNHRLIVLNPTTKDFLELPSPNCCFDDPKGDQIRHFKEYYLYGFSYDSFTDDYKVVTIFSNKRFLPIVHVYSLRSNTWKHVIEFPYKPFQTTKMSSSSAFTSGNIHRLAKNRCGYYVPTIVAFSVADETFSEVPPPYHGDVLVSGHCKLVDVGGKLGLFEEVDGKVWLMNEYGVKKSWTTISLHGLHKNPICNEPAFLHTHQDGNIILVVRRNLIMIYNVEDKGRCKYCKATYPLGKDLTAKAICVESLVSPINYGLTD